MARHVSRRQCNNGAVGVRDSSRRAVAEQKQMRTIEAEAEQKQIKPRQATKQGSRSDRQPME